MKKKKKNTRNIEKEMEKVFSKKCLLVGVFVIEILKTEVVLLTFADSSKIEIGTYLFLKYSRNCIIVPLVK